MSPFTSQPPRDEPSLPDAPRRSGPGPREKLAAHALAADVARLHGDALLRTAARYSLNDDDAYDAYQRALERLLEHASTIDRSKTLAWMHVVVRREAGVVRRHHGPTTVPLEAEDVDEALHRLATQPDEQVHAIDLAQRAGEALATLKESEAQALCLRAQGLSYEEIGETYGWSYSKVNRAVTEGRRAFVDHYTAVETGAVCADTAELVGRYADGTLKPRVALKVRAHLVRCSGCRALLHAHRGADTALRALLPPVFVIAASERVRGAGWLHDHLLGPLGHLAGRFQPAADLVLGSKVGLVAASTVALAGSGLAVERTVNDRPAAPTPLAAGLTAPSVTADATSAPADAPLVRVVGHAVDNGRAAATRARERVAAAKAARVAKARRIARAERRRKAAAEARATANANEFAGSVSEFDTTTRNSATAAARRSTAPSGTAASGGSAGATGGGGGGSAPEIEVPADAPSDSPTIDVIDEGSSSPDG